MGTIEIELEETDEESAETPLSAASEENPAGEASVTEELSQDSLFTGAVTGNGFGKGVWWLLVASGLIVLLLAALEFYRWKK